jgi:hypothetical protein
MKEIYFELKFKFAEANIMIKKTVILALVWILAAFGNGNYLVLINLFAKIN